MCIYKVCVCVYIYIYMAPPSSQPSAKCINMVDFLGGVPYIYDIYICIYYYLFTIYFIPGLEMTFKD